MTSDDRYKAALNLRTFMQELDMRLSAFTLEELKSVLVQHARRLPSSERSDFLAMFAYAPPETTPPQDTTVRDDELMTDIESFVEELENGVYYEGWDWDDSIHDERAYGDESWIGMMDDLFARASAMYLAGHRDLAGDAYGQLLHAFELDQEVGHFSGEGSPDTLIETDLGEAKARYLHCIYETSTPEDRIDKMMEAIEDLHYFGGEITLSNIMNADTEPLPGIDEFIQAWITELNAMDVAVTSEYAVRWWRPLLREAVVIRNGLDGLAELARESGDVHPEAYQEWMTTLWQSGDITSAISVARDAVKRIVSTREKARMADALATMAVQEGDSDLAVAARKQAWRAYPSLPRLVRYLTEGSPIRRTVDMRLDEELSGVSNGTGTDLLRSDRSEQIPRLCLLLHLLAHDYDFVIQQRSKADHTMWGYTDEPGPIVFTTLVLAASGMTSTPSEGSSLAGMLDTMAHSVRHYTSEHPLLPDTGESTKLLFCRLLFDTLACYPVTQEDKTKYLRMASTIAQSRVDHIVTNKLRGHYEEAARLVVAIGETMVLQGNTAAASDFATSIREAYPRHVAFHRELEQLIGQSPYHPPLLRRRK